MNFQDYRNDEHIGLKSIEIQIQRQLTGTEVLIAKRSFHVGYDLGSNDGYDEGKQEQSESMTDYWVAGQT